LSQEYVLPRFIGGTLHLPADAVKKLFRPPAGFIVCSVEITTLRGATVFRSKFKQVEGESNASL